MLFLLIFFSLFLSEFALSAKMNGQDYFFDPNASIHKIVHLKADLSGYVSKTGELLFVSDSDLQKKTSPNDEDSLNKKSPSQDQVAVATDSSKQEDVSKETEEAIDINFDSITLADLIKIVASKKNFNYSISKDLENIKLPAIKSYTPKTISQLWEIVLTFIKENGFVHEDRGGLHLFTKDGQLYPIFSSRETAVNDLPDSDQTIRYIYYLNNIKADSAAAVLNSILTEKPIIIGDLDILLIKEKSRNVKQAMKIIRDLDVGGVHQSISILPLQYTEPDAIAQLLNNEFLNSNDRVRIFNPFKKNLKYFSSDVKVYPYAEKDCLIFLGQISEINRIIHFIKMAIDIKIENAQSRIHIKEIKYHSPEMIKNYLQRLLRPNGPQDQRFKDIVIYAESPASSGGYSNSGGGSAGSRIIVACNNEEWRLIEDLVDKLDKPSQTVAVEIMIVDASLALQKALGAHLRDSSDGLISPNLSFRTNTFAESIAMDASPREAPLASGYLTSLSGSTVMSIAGGILNSNAWAFIRAQSNKNNATIIYQPFIVVKNNEQGTWSQEDSITVDGDITTSGSKVSRVREKVRAKTSAVVKPKLNLSGLVDLEVDVNISEFLENVSGQAVSPNRTIRQVKTRATIGMGEVLALAGFDKSKLSKVKTSVPLLGSIPLIGNLFKNSSKNSDKQQLYVFIRVSAMKQEGQEELDDYSALKVKYAKYQIGNADSYAESRDPIMKVFFKPRHSSVKETVADFKNDRFSYIDDFVEGKDNPLNTRPAFDKDFNPNSEIEDARKNLDSYWSRAGYRKSSDVLSKLKTKNKAKQIIEIEELKVRDKNLLKNYLARN